MLALARQKLAEANESRANDHDWPAGQTWSDLSNSSRSLFLKAAREEAGIPHDDFLAVIRLGKVDVSDLYDGR
jgi:hypothetical protein